MQCRKCGSNNLFVTNEQSKAKTKKKKMGILWSIGRIFMIVCTSGLWLIFGKKSGTEKTRYKFNTVAICQNCGNKQKVS